MHIFDIYIYMHAWGSGGLAVKVVYKILPLSLFTVYYIMLR